MDGAELFLCRDVAQEDYEVQITVQGSVELFGASITPVHAVADAARPRSTRRPATASRRGGASSRATGSRIVQIQLRPAIRGDPSRGPATFFAVLPRPTRSGVSR